MSNTNTVAKVLANMDGAKDLDLGVLIGAFHLPTWAGKVMDTAKLGHGTAGHFPDISWLEYALTQDGGQRYRSNPKVFACAFGKMIEVLGIAHNGAARTDIGELIKGTLLRIEEERGVKIQQYGAMWFWTSRIASEERDTVFKHFMELDYFDLRDGYTPGNLDDDYKAYLDDVGIAGKELKDNPASDIINRHYFLNATVWHRENVMTEIWKKFPDFPSSLKMNPA
jgi:hypothetical protein